MISEIEQLEKMDAAHKPEGADQEWSKLQELYEDQSRSTTLHDLRTAGMGMKDERMPLDLARMLRQVIDRGATIYRQPPSRFLMGAGGKRLAESNAEHKKMLDVTEAAQYDVVWRRVDRLRSLLGQVCVRFYPSDARECVVMRVFSPQHIMRAPDPACSDLMDHDQEFALRLSGDVVEHWYRHPEARDVWCMRWMKKNEQLPPEQQPFAAEGITEEHYVSPYGELPVQMVYSDHAGGAPWLAPSQSRRAWVTGLTRQLNDVGALVKMQAHNTRVYKRRRPESRLAEDTGSSVTLAIDAEEDLYDLKPSPAIEQCLSVIKLNSRLFATTEYLPGSEFDPEKQILTGAALRVQLQPLHDRREDQVPLVLPDEQSAWRRLRAVHNFHAPAWGSEALDLATVMDVEVADLEAPTTPTEAGNLASRQLALGSASMIDIIMRERSCTRPEAIKLYERVGEDFEKYPPLNAASDEPEESTGPRPMDIPEPGPTAADEQPDEALDGRPSIAATIRSVG